MTDAALLKYRMMSTAEERALLEKDDALKDVSPDILNLTNEEIQNRTRLLENEIKVSDPTFIGMV